MAKDKTPTELIGEISDTIAKICDDITRLITVIEELKAQLSEVWNEND